MYYEATLIVEGALDSTEEFTESDDLLDWINKAKQDIALSPYSAEIYVLEHPHDQNIGECFCIQYVQHHKPALTLA